MLEIDANKMKRVIEKSGLKQKYVSERILGQRVDNLVCFKHKMLKSRFFIIAGNN